MTSVFLITAVALYVFVGAFAALIAHGFNAFGKSLDRFDAFEEALTLVFWPVALPLLWWRERRRLRLGRR